jgi:Domain of unknown function (DUF4034)
MSALKLRYLVIASLIFGSLASAQETSSLGDVARKLRTERKTTVNSPRKVAGIQAVDSLSTPPASGSIRVAPGPTKDQTTDSYEDNLRKLLESGRFEDIDELAAAARQSKTRLRGGYWELHILYEALSEPASPNPSDADFEAQVARLKRWGAQKPRSTTAQVALAIAYNKYAWNARGDTYANQVSEDTWKVFAERVQLAKKALDDSRSLERDAEWYLAFQQIGLSDGVDLQHMTALFKQAVAFEPGYQYFYREQAEALLPRWLGETGDAARFAAQVANEIGPKQGDLIYYHIATFLWCHCDINDDYKAFDWQRIKRGYQVQHEIYGDSISTLTQMARIAYDGGDYELADEMFTRLNGARDAKIMPSKEFYDAAREYSSGITREKAIEQARKEAETNLQTVQGRTYSDQLMAAFSRDYSFVVQQCSFSTGSATYAPFQVAIRIGKNGAVEKVYPSLNSEMGHCMTEKLATGSFPVPPQPSYWAIVSLK